MRIKLERLEEALFQDNNVGFCLNCGQDAHNVEPDARDYKCESCGRNRVYGAEEIILMSLWE